MVAGHSKKILTEIDNFGLPKLFLRSILGYNLTLPS